MKVQILRKSKINKNGDELASGLMEDMIKEFDKDKKSVVLIHAEPPPKWMFESETDRIARCHAEHMESVLNQIKIDKENQETYYRKMRERTNFSGWTDEEIAEYQWLYQS
jgi:hypothetical protein